MPRLATWFTPRYKNRSYLALQNRKGYISPSTVISHPELRLGDNVYIGDRVVIHRDRSGGPVELGDRVHLHDYILVEIGPGGGLKVGADTHIQPRCQITSYEAPIEIGKGVQIAPNCAFFSYDHGIVPGTLISRQPLQTKGPILVGDDAWLGVGVIVLSGVRIGKGAVVGAGSVVTRDVMDGAIVAGVPARVVKMRDELTAHQQGAHH